ncbi:MAG: GspH/FimT family pseudopilin [Pikeienuella sp.]
MMRPTSGSDPHGAAGLTLLELLVVMALLGILMVASAGFLASGPPRLEAGVREVRAALVETRAEALRRGRPMMLRIDNEAGHLLGPFGQRALPLGIGAQILPNAPPRPGDAPKIVFFPDGSASGGRIALSDGSERAVITVAWLTGAVTQQHDASADD